MTPYRWFFVVILAGCNSQGDLGDAGEFPDAFETDVRNDAPRHDGGDLDGDVDGGDVDGGDDLDGGELDGGGDLDAGRDAEVSSDGGETDSGRAAICEACLGRRCPEARDVCSDSECLGIVACLDRYDIEDPRWMACIDVEVELATRAVQLWVCRQDECILACSGPWPPLGGGECVSLRSPCDPNVPEHDRCCDGECSDASGRCCIAPGEECVTAADCCGGAATNSCTAGVCQPRMCYSNAEACDDAFDCCVATEVCTEFEDMGSFCCLPDGAEITSPDELCCDGGRRHEGDSEFCAAAPPP